MITEFLYRYEQLLEKHKSVEKDYETLKNVGKFIGISLARKFENFLDLPFCFYISYFISHVLNIFIKGIKFNKLTVLRFSAVKTKVPNKVLTDKLDKNIYI